MTIKMWGNSNLTNYNFMFCLIHHKLLPTQSLKMFLTAKALVEYKGKLKLFVILKYLSVSS